MIFSCFVVDLFMVIVVLRVEEIRDSCRCLVAKILHYAGLSDPALCRVSSGR